MTFGLWSEASQPAAREAFGQHKVLSTPLQFEELTIHREPLATELWVGNTGKVSTQDDKLDNV